MSVGDVRGFQFAVMNLMLEPHMDHFKIAFTKVEIRLQRLPLSAPTPTSSTSKCNNALGGIAGGAPLAPYARCGGMTS